MRKLSHVHLLGCAALLLLFSCGGHGSSLSGGPQGNASNPALPAPQVDGWVMPELPGTSAPQPSDPAGVRARLQPFELPLAPNTRTTSGVIKTLPDDNITVHNAYPTPGFFDFRVSTPFDAQTPATVNVKGNLTFSGPLTQRYIQVGLVNNATYNYAMDPDGNPLTSDANPSYLFNQNAVLVCALDNAGNPFVAPLDYNNSAGIGAAQAVAGNFSFNLKLQPSGATGGNMSLSINGGAFGATHTYGTNNWGWVGAESMAQARLVVQVYSYNPSAAPFTVGFSNVVADDPNYIPPPPPSNGWVHSYGLSGNDRGISQVADINGNVDFAGYVAGAGTTDALMMQFSPSGAVNWAKAWGAGQNDNIAKVVTDASGNIYGAGQNEIVGDDEFLLLKYSPTGTLLLSKRWGLAAGQELANSLVRDGAGNIYMVGQTNTSGPTGPAVAVVKLDPAGNLLWDKSWDGATNESATDVCLGSDGNVYATGFTNSFGIQRGFLVKYDPNGNLLGQQTIGSAGNQVSMRSIAEGPGGKLYLVGTLNGGGIRALILKVDEATLALDWQETWSGAGNEDGQGVAVAANGRIFVSGKTSSFGGQPGLFAIVLNASGNLLAQQKWAHTTLITDAFNNKLSLAADGSVLMGGMVANVNSWAWNDVASPVSAATGTWQTVSFTDLPIGGTVAAPVGVESIPAGVLDTGAGGTDALIIKHQVTGPSISNVAIDATALPNAKFTVWNPTGPTPYTGSLSTNSVFDASNVLLTGDQFYLSFAVDSVLAPDDLALYPARPDNVAGGFVTVTPGGLTLGGTLGTWFTASGQTLTLKTGAYNRITNDMAAGQPDSFYTLRDGTLATIGGPWDAKQSGIKHVVLAEGVNYRPVWSPQLYPLGGSSPAHNGASETIYPSEWQLNFFSVGFNAITEVGITPGMGDYFTQAGLVNTMDSDAYVRIDSNPSGVVNSPYTIQVSPTFANVTPALKASAQPWDVVTLARGLTFRARDNSGNTTGTFSVDAGRKLSGASSVNLTFGGGGGTLGLAVLPVRVFDDPDAVDPDLLVTGANPWTVTLNFLLQYGAPNYTVQLDADYGTSWNDGTPGRVYNITGSPYAAPGVASGTATVNNQSPGTYKFALRVTDANSAVYTYVWPVPVTLNAQGWTISQPNAASSGAFGQYSSMAIVNGNPAMTFWDSANEDLMYVRATDVNGGNWSAPITLDGTGGNDRGWYTSLAVINGNPAVSYAGSGGIGGNGLFYLRASDANGTAWGSPVTLTGGQCFTTSLLPVNGNPAVALSFSDGNTYYIRATDVNGTAWGGFTSLGQGDYVSMAIVSGNPALAFYRNGQARYVRATDASGGGWGSSVVADNGGGFDAGWFDSLVVVNGNPAIADYDADNGALHYVRATNATGSAWGAVQVLDNGGDTGAFPSMSIIGGNPAISYFDITNGALRYESATDASGTTWNAPLTLDSSNCGDYSTLLPVNGQPGISYYEGTNYDLKFIRFYP